MPTFFHGWRRKAGCVTLVMACGAMVMWVRSEVVHDEFRFFDHGPGCYHTASSYRGSLSWEFHAFTPYVELRALSSDFPSVFQGHFEDGFFVLDNGAFVFVNRQFFGFEFTDLAEIVDSDGQPGSSSWERIQSVKVPYWSITTPLTFLSACLILWKPRKAK